MSTSTVLYLVLGIAAFFLMMRMHGGHGGHGSHDQDGARSASKRKRKPAHEHAKNAPPDDHSDR